MTKIEKLGYNVALILFILFLALMAILAIAAIVDLHKSDKAITDFCEGKGMKAGTTYCVDIEGDRLVKKPVTNYKGRYYFEEDSP